MQTTQLVEELERLRQESLQLKWELNEKQTEQRWRQLFELNKSVQWLVDTETFGMIEAN